MIFSIVEFMTDTLRKGFPLVSLFNNSYQQLLLIQLWTPSVHMHKWLQTLITILPS